MSAPIVTVVALAGPLLAVRPADVDGDGQRDLVAATAGHGPVDLATLTVVGVEVEQTHTRLPEQPGWWDAGHGLWLLDPDGLHELGSGTTLPGIGGVTPGQGVPAQADLVVDLDHDGAPELLIPGTDALRVCSTTGRLWGSVPLHSTTTTQARRRAGGQVFARSDDTAAVAVADVNGDGTDDLVLVTDSEIRVHLAAPGALSSVALRWPLPDALRPPPAGSAADAWTTSARWTDLDGDGRTDLLIHRLHSEGRLASTRSEVSVLLGRGTDGLGPPQRISSKAGAQDLFAVDLDGDGDRDVLQPRLKLDVGNLAQAVVSQSVDVELVALPMDEGRLGDPVQLRQVSLPVDGSKAAWSMFEDLTGDGLPDLAVVVDGDLQVFQGHGLSIDRRPLMSASLGVQADNLWALDLTGDGAAELVAWAPGERSLAVIQLPTGP